MSKSDDALIGATGLLGSALRNQRHFSATARSTTIAALAGQAFDTMFIAAAKGSMFEANKAPARDADHIASLISSLAKIGADRAVLISTVAVLESFDGGFDEDTARFRDDLAYGRNRRTLEISVAKLFPQTLIVRLPALFGVPLKKNFVFDLMNPVPTMLTSGRRDALQAALPDAQAKRLDTLYSHARNLDMWVLDRDALDADPDKPALETAVIEAGFEAARFVHRDSTFQYYDLRNLSADIDCALRGGVEVLHLAPEPIAASEVHQRLTGRPMPETEAKLHKEDMQTSHAELFGRTGRYIADGDDVLDTLSAWVTANGGCR